MTEPLKPREEGVGAAEELPDELPRPEEPRASVEAKEGSRLGEAAPWIVALLGGIGGIGALGYLRGRYQHSTVYLPKRLPDGIDQPGAHELPLADVWFESADGLRLHGWWIAQPGAVGTILYCHGSSGSITHRVDVFRGFSRLRMNVFAFDYRGYGRSPGVPSERGLYADVRGAYQHLVGPLGLSPAEILLFGHSLGGAVAIEAARHCPVAGLVVESSFTDIKEMARTLYPQLPLHWICRNEFRSIEKVAELAMPKLFIHGAADATVPLAVGRKLFDAAAPPKELFLVDRAEHNDVHVQGGDRYLHRLARFARLCLR